MPAILYSNSSPLASTAGAPATRPKPNRNRTIYNMHSSRNGHKMYPQSTRSRPVQPSISPTSVSSSTTHSLSATSPTPSVLSPASSSISFFPPYTQQLTSHPQPSTQSRSSSQSSLESTSSRSSSTSTSSNRSSLMSMSMSPLTAKPSSTSTTTTSSGTARRSSKGTTITDAYRRRYASYLASTFNMSMETALIEADYQLLPQMVGKECGISEAEVFRSD